MSTLYNVEYGLFKSDFKVDIIVAAENTTPHHIIRETFDFTVCQAMWTVGGDLSVPLPRFTLNKQTLLCPTNCCIVHMHYIARLIDNSRTSFDNAIKRFGKFSSALGDLFPYHRDIVCLETGTRFEFSCKHLDDYHHYWYENFTINEVKAVWILFYVAQNVRWNMIVDPRCHVNVLQRGQEYFPCEYDGCHDVAVKQHNYFCHLRRIDRFNKYAIERGFQVYGLPEMNAINLQEGLLIKYLIYHKQCAAPFDCLKLNVNTCLKTKC